MTNLWIEKESQLFWYLSQVHSHCTSTKITDFLNSPPLPEATHSQQPAAADPFLNQVAIGFHPLLPTPLMRSDTKPQKSTAAGIMVGSLQKKICFPKIVIFQRPKSEKDPSTINNIFKLQEHPPIPKKNKQNCGTCNFVGNLRIPFRRVFSSQVAGIGFSFRFNGTVAPWLRNA